MGQWQYMSATIFLEENFFLKQNQYVLPLLDGRKLRGIDTIMNYWASYGWELVSLVPIEFIGESRSQVVRLIAVFKRWQDTPQQGGSGGGGSPRLFGPLGVPRE
jgi:hypothetical protein